MIYVGIDIAKLNHFAAAISSEGGILIEPFKFSNDYDGFYLLLSKLAPLDQDSIIIGLESTAHYGDNLVRFLISKDFKVCVLNPLSTSAMRKNNVRKTKTDKVDTFVIAKTLMLHFKVHLLKGSGLHRTQGTRQIPTENREAAHPFKNTADFLHGSGLPGTTALL